MMTDPAGRRPEMMQEKSKIFFPNLDGLRFIAFFAVFFHHSLIVNCFNSDKGSFTHRFVAGMKENGALGVNLFFVLSGFLITYLLLSEKNKFARINIPNFYLRRTLRIWPLYFLMVFTGFVLFPLIKKMLGGIPDETHSPGFYFLFISNFEQIRKGLADSSILNVLWSVGVEEQFYILWPVVLFLVPVRHMLKIFALLIGITIVFRWMNKDNPGLIYFHTLSIFSDMVVGGISAWLAFSFPLFKELIQRMPRKIIISIYTAGTLLILCRFMIFSNSAYIVFERIILSLFFAFVIIEQNFAGHSFYKLRNSKFLTNWGNYTYGLYCLHTIGLLGAHILSEKLLHLQNNWFIMGIDFSIGLGLTMFMAYISYSWFESPFLKLKSRFAYFIK